MKTLLPAILFTLSSALAINAQTHSGFLDSPNAYLGQTPPGDTPQPFAPGRFNEPGTISMDRTGMSVDGKQICIGQNDAWYSLKNAKLKCFSFDGAKWVGPTVFAEHMYAPSFSADGNSLYLLGEKGTQVWKSIKTKEGWSAPSVFLEDEHDMYDFMPTISGTYYVGSNPDPADLKNGITYSFSTVTGSGKNLIYKSLGRPLNETGFNGDFYVSPDESFMIVSAKESRDGECELFISFHKPDGTWTNPKSLGAKINNTVAHRWGQSVTPDRKYLFYSLGTSAKDCTVVWVRFDDILEQTRHSNFDPYVKTPIAEQSATANAPFSLKLADNIFIDDDGNDTLSLTATSANNVALPSWLKFDPQSKSFSGTPPEPSTYLITVTAMDPAKSTAASLFTLTVH